MAFDNYVKIGWGSDHIFVFFSSKDVNSPTRVRKEVDAHMAARPSQAPVAMWKPCPGLSYPIVGETARGSS